MGLGVLRRVRPGVLIGLGLTAWMLRSAVNGSWWSASLALSDLTAPVLSLPDLHGGAFGWSAAAACAALAAAALPLPGRARLTATALGCAAAVTTAVMLVVVARRVLAHDAAAHRAWTPLIWSRYLADRAESDGRGAYFGVAETSSDGVALAGAAVFLLLLLATLLALPRRHERTVLLGSALALIVAALLTPAFTVWVTTGPQSVHRTWVWLPAFLTEARGPVVILLVLAAVLGAGFFVRPGGPLRRGWGIAWAWILYPTWIVAAAATTYLADPGHLSLLDRPYDSPAPVADRGVLFNGLLGLLFFLPAVVNFRVAAIDLLTVRRSTHP